MASLLSPVVSPILLETRSKLRESMSNDSVSTSSDISDTVVAIAISNGKTFCSRGLTNTMIMIRCQSDFMMTKSLCGENLVSIVFPSLNPILRRLRFTMKRWSSWWHNDLDDQGDQDDRDDWNDQGNQSDQDDWDWQGDQWPPAKRLPAPCWVLGILGASQACRFKTSCFRESASKWRISSTSWNRRGVIFANTRLWI